MKDNKRYLAESLVLYTVAYAIFFVTSTGLQTNDYLLRARQFIIIAVVAFFVQRTLGQRLLSRAHAIPLLIGAGWMLVWPSVEWAQPTMHIYAMTAYDVMAGAYLGLLLMLAQAFCHQRVFRILFAAVCLLLFSVSVVQLVYFLLYGQPIDDTSLMAICQTTLIGSWSWLTTYVGYPSLFVILLALLALAYGAYRCLVSTTQVLQGRSRWLVLVLLISVGAYWGGHLY